jgi:hypothetical protein
MAAELLLVFAASSILLLKTLKYDKEIPSIESTFFLTLNGRYVLA